MTPEVGAALAVIAERNNMASNEEKWKRIEINRYELNVIENKIKELVSQYNELAEKHNTLKLDNSTEYIIYTNVEKLAPEWVKDGVTHISDISEAYSANPAWYSSSWCPRSSD